MIPAFRRAALPIAMALAASLADAAAAATPPKSPTPTPPGPAAGGTPCAAPEQRQFDFWVGDWDVTGPDGKPTGQNKVVRVLNGCALEENWTGAQGAHGTSLSIYDAATRRWHQTWVDDSGGLLVLDGEFRDGKMALIGRRPSQKEKGTTITHRITWTPVGADRVRQFWQASSNDGRTWKTVFDGTYVRKK